MIFNEEKFAKEVILGQHPEIKNIRQKIDLFARYNYFILHKETNNSYRSIVLWMKKHQDIFSENSYCNLIYDLIKKAPKNPFYKIDALYITENELNIITSQNNLRYEKLLFVLLCMAKLQKTIYGFDNGLISYNIVDVFKMARVSVKASERETILHNFFIQGLIDLPIKNSSKCLFIKFIDNEPSSNIIYSINEKDSEELAYYYLKYVKHDKIIKCKRCGRLIKKTNKFDNLCEICYQNTQQNKILWCIDCGSEFTVDLKNVKTIRCQHCQDIKNKENTLLRVQKYRSDKQ